MNWLNKRYIPFVVTIHVETIVVIYRKYKQNQNKICDFWIVFSMIIVEEK